MLRAFLYCDYSHIHTALEYGLVIQTMHFYPIKIAGFYRNIVDTYIVFWHRQYVFWYRHAYRGLDCL